QGGDDAGLIGRVPRGIDELQLGAGPGFVKPPGVAGRADDVVAAVHDDAGDVGDLVHVAQELGRGREEAVVNEVVTLDAGKGEGKGCIVAVGDEVAVLNEGGDTAFPPTPCFGGELSNAG